MDRYIMSQKAKAAINFLTMLAASEKIAPSKDPEWYIKSWCMTSETRLPVYDNIRREMKPMANRLEERIN